MLFNKPYIEKIAIDTNDIVVVASPGGSDSYCVNGTNNCDSYVPGQTDPEDCSDGML